MRMIGVMTLAMIGFLAAATAFTSVASAQTQMQIQSEEYMIISTVNPFSPRRTSCLCPDTCGTSTIRRQVSGSMRRGDDEI
jgi:Tfp pilus assembly protein PilV